MDSNHPIPQDVTGFQFKLIGAMTVKQFGYVASGVVMAVILYYLPLHSVLGIIFKVIFIPLLSSSGIIIAFVPLEGRPIDVMTSNFVKALFSPNQYIYHRQGQQLSFTAVSLARTPLVGKMQAKSQPQADLHIRQLDQKTEKLRTLLRNAHNPSTNIVSESDKKEAAFLNALTVAETTTTLPVSISASLTSPAPLVTKKAAPQLDSPQIIAKTIPSPSSQVREEQSPQMQLISPMKEQKQEDLSKLESELQQELSKAKQEESTSKTVESHTAAMQKISLLSKQIQEIHAQKQQLEQELTTLQKQLASEKSAVSVIPKIPSAPIQDPQHVRTIPQAGTKKVGLPHVSDSPNVVVGIVKDPRDNILPNILVEVKDSEGNPVRAFKTNALGQFASATPLSPGVYTIELEDPKKQHQFDVIQITANNQILLPIEIISHDAREELRKQLFSS